MNYDHFKNLALEKGESEMFAELFSKHCLWLYEEIRSDIGFADMTENEKVAYAKESSFIYLAAYKRAIELGHSEVFALTYAHNYFDTDSESAANNAGYKELRILGGSDQVFEEADGTCKKLGESKIYCTVYAKKIAGGTDSESASLDAKKYENFYKNKIKEGKSEIYSIAFADNDGGKYGEFYADTYEELINQGKTIEYAQIYADYFAEKAHDMYCKETNIDFEEHILFSKLCAGAYSDAYFYAKQNGLSPKKFAERFEMMCLGIYEKGNQEAIQAEFERIAKNISK